ncbi:TetR/AcrR family transcriptional regulator [Streptomyces sp. B1866]|uniref:TetR/AcrR family transcriptional regulator n=1 Tax=Streptomyces sp. B1866 TaxID=3075431 RepID=UPI0028918348|nr:TetR/AcrR family transcriptional regulator [Streptomyces sp. B1866]MDT3400252.1 TetR/AcrR family transcriptional regulator [Streptomyces sp. B1866]
MAPDSGLTRALMEDRALALGEAVETGPPPLGPGAPPRERLTAFLDAVVDVVGRSKGLMAAIGHAMSTAPQPPEEQAESHPVYRAWHGHASRLIAEERPDADADVLAHLLLAALHSAPVLAMIQGEAPRVAAALRTLAAALLDAPPDGAPGTTAGGAGP